MSDMNVNAVLSQMRALAARSGVEAVRDNSAVDAANKPDFSGLLKNSINQVNELQQTSAKTAASFEAGDANVSLVDTMVASQKSSVAFQATVQVRNKLVAAYEEIMRMQV